MPLPVKVRFGLSRNDHPCLKRMKSIMMKVNESMPKSSHTAARSPVVGRLIMRVRSKRIDPASPDISIWDTRLSVKADRGYESSETEYLPHGGGVPLRLKDLTC